jgi:hypothetical protein
MIIAMAIGINFGRIWAYLEHNKRNIARSLTPVTVLLVALAAIFTGKRIRKHLMPETMVQAAIR